MARRWGRQPGWSGAAALENYQPFLTLHQLFKPVKNQVWLAAELGQQQIEQEKRLTVHALMMNHDAGAATGKSLLQFGQEVVEANAGRRLLSGMEVDVDPDVRQNCGEIVLGAGGA